MMKIVCFMSTVVEHIQRERWKRYSTIMSHTANQLFRINSYVDIDSHIAED